MERFGTQRTARSAALMDIAAKHSLSESVGAPESRFACWGALGRGDLLAAIHQQPRFTPESRVEFATPSALAPENDDFAGLHGE